MSSLFLKNGLFGRSSLFTKILLRFFSFFLIYLFVVLFFSCSCGKATKDPKVNNLSSGEKDTTGWGSVTENAPWGPRAGFQALVFDDKIWLLGGYGANFSERRSDIIWNSADGTNWQKVQTVGNVWEPRNGLGAVVFKDKMWIMGGQKTPTNKDDTAFLSDIWNTSDGINWTKITPIGDGPSGSQPKVVVHDNKIWVLGKFFDNHVFQSADGVNWTKVVADGTKWSRRIYHGVASFDGKMWVVAGDLANRNVVKDVWSSQNGVNWTEHTVTNPDWKERKLFEMLPFNEKLWIFGGMTDRSGSDTFYDDVWTTTDGEDWKKVDLGSDKHWSSRSTFKVVEFQGNLWLLGGQLSGNPLSDVWRFIPAP